MHLDRLKDMRLLSILLFVLIMIVNWIYIFSLSQSAYIINSVTILMPFLLPLFGFFILSISFRIYIQRPYGFLAAYIVILLSIICIFVAFIYIPRIVHEDYLYLISLLIMNAVVTIYLASYQYYLYLHHISC